MGRLERRGSHFRCSACRWPGPALPCLSHLPRRSLAAAACASAATLGKVGRGDTDSLRLLSAQERPDKKFRLAVGSFVEEYNNKVDIITARGPPDPRAHCPPNCLLF